MKPNEREQYMHLLRQIVSSGGVARVGSHLDESPYRRMQKRGWLTRRDLGGGEAIYEVTKAGRQVCSA